MGKATVVSGGTDGNYQVKIDYGKGTQTARTATIAARLTELATKITETQGKLDAEDANTAGLKAMIESAINAYAAGTRATLADANTIKALLQTYTQAAAALSAHVIKVAPLRLALQLLKDEKAQALKDQAYWQGLTLEETRQAWCADLTETATGAVATIEIPGESALILIAPAAPAPMATDGALTAREVQTPSQAFFNAAILPGWQKYKPTYRRGVITAIDTAADTADITLSSDLSSAQQLKINQADTLSKVPVQYMTCNSGAFTVGDRCVVKFVGQDFGAPRVVGFVDHPKACGYILSGAIKGGSLVSVAAPPGSPPGTLPTSTLRSYKPTAQAYVHALKSDPAKSPSAFNDEPKLARQGNQYVTLLPSMYSGLMAKAVAVIMGGGHAVQYDFHFAHCHGITVGVDGTRWLVEVSIDNGVIAMRLPVAPGAASSVQDVIRESVALFGGVPTGATFPTGAGLVAAIAQGSVIRLAATTDLLPYYSNNAYIDTLGWSFNDTGTEAHNTCWWQNGAGYYFSSHYKLAVSIGALAANRVSGTPAAIGTATLTLESQGPLTTPSGYGAIIPFLFSDGAGGLVSPPVTVTTGLETAASTPLFACHQNGVLEVIYSDIVIPQTDATWVESGLIHPPFSGTAVVVTREGYGGRRIRGSAVYREPGVYTRYTRTLLSVVSIFCADNISSDTAFASLMSVNSHRHNTLNDVVTWPGTSRDCYLHVTDALSDLRRVTHEGRLWTQSELNQAAIDGNVATGYSLNYIPEPTPPNHNDYDYIQTIVQITQPNGSTNFKQVPGYIIPRQTLTNQSQVTAHLPDGSEVVYQDATTATYGQRWASTVRHSVFGTQQAVLQAGYYVAFFGSLLSGEIDQGPGRPQYNFIGYT